MTHRLPEGVLVGHWTDREAWTGCSVVLLPEGSVTSCEVRGGGPGTLGTDLLRPEAGGPGAQAILLTGGSAFGLAAAAGVVRYLEERGVGFQTRVAKVPLVAGAVVYDLAVGDAAVRPGPDEAYAACAASGPAPERGSVGAGTGCSVGKLLGAERWTKGGLGIASLEVEGLLVAAVAVVNAVGEVVDEDGSVIAGVRGEGGFDRTADLLRAGTPFARPWQEATTLVCVLTDARLTKTQAWLVARAANAGVARAVVPVWTPFDGDTVFCAATGARDADPVVVAALAAEVAAEAIRDGVRQATGAPGCPAASEI
ncbi:MAG TPA: P1 family peptidase [Gaiellaceae bacterium]|nr:P1 family peptidase [Gaiellaceae bacterium]